MKGNSAESVGTCASAEVLWTWHIWCTPDDIDASTLKLRNNAGVMMDRNLGALTSERSIKRCLTLLYQYGSRHPFIGGYVKSVISPFKWRRSVE